MIRCDFGPHDLDGEVPEVDARGRVVQVLCRPCQEQQVEARRQRSLKYADRLLDEFAEVLAREIRPRRSEA